MKVSKQEADSVQCYYPLTLSSHENELMILQICETREWFVTNVFFRVWQMGKEWNPNKP